MPTALKLYDNYTRSLRGTRRSRPARSASTPAARRFTTTSIGNFRAFLFEDSLATR